MSDRFTRVILSLLFLLVLAFVAHPYINTFFNAADAPRAITPRGDLTQSETNTIELFRRASPSVVHVFTQSGRRFLQRSPQPGADPAETASQTGTGFIWDAAGHVVTNNHVIAGGGTYSVRLAGGEVVQATLVGRSPQNDLAVLRLARATQLPPALAIGQSANLQVGQSVYAIGNPFGLDQTLTTGVISALRRTVPTGDGTELTDVIQMDAAINPGNSGGPLLDSAGRLIGVNTAIYSPSGASAGIGFAVPVDTVNQVVPQLIRQGRLPQAGIGIAMGDESTAARIGVAGVIVVRVLPGSPAARVGLQGVDQRTGEIGDIIVAVNDRPVRRPSDLTRALQQAGVGQSVQLTIDRDGRMVRVNVGVVDVGGRG